MTIKTAKRLLRKDKAKNNRIGLWEKRSNLVHKRKNSNIYQLRTIIFNWNYFIALKFVLYHHLETLCGFIGAWILNTFNMCYVSYFFDTLSFLDNLQVYKDSNVFCFKLYTFDYFFFLEISVFLLTCYGKDQNFSFIQFNYYL